MVIGFRSVAIRLVLVTLWHLGQLWLGSGVARVSSSMRCAS